MRRAVRLHARATRVVPRPARNAPCIRKLPGPTPEIRRSLEPDMNLNLNWQQIVGLFVLAIPIACVARTVVFEEVFREPREWCKYRSETCSGLLSRKFFYLFTCEYCFSHWVTLAVLIVTRYHLMYGD